MRRIEPRYLGCYNGRGRLINLKETVDAVSISPTSLQKLSFADKPVPTLVPRCPNDERVAAILNRVAH